MIHLCPCLSSFCTCFTEEMLRRAHQRFPMHLVPIHAIDPFLSLAQRLAMLPCCLLCLMHCGVHRFPRLAFFMLSMFDPSMSVHRGRCLEEMLRHWGCFCGAGAGAG